MCSQTAIPQSASQQPPIKAMTAEQQAFIEQSLLKSHVYSSLVPALMTQEQFKTYVKVCGSLHVRHQAQHCGLLRCPPQLVQASPPELHSCKAPC